MHSIHLFINIVETHLYWGYLILFVAMLIEGELILTAAGMLASLHAFNLYKAYFIALAGVLTGDILWYSVGRYLGAHHTQNKYLLYINKKVTKLFPNITENPFLIIFLSKFIYGLNHSTIVVLGYNNVKFIPFFKIQIFASILWTLMFFSMGYVFGDVALEHTHSLDRFIMLTLLFLIGVMVVKRVMGRIIEKRMQKK